VFFPRGFRAESINGGAPGSAYDRLEFEILANAGFSISDIRVVEFGDYGVIGQGQVSVGGTLFATDLALGAPVVSDNLVSNPGSPIFTGIGNWQANAAVNVAAINSPRFRIVLNNNLFAISDGNGSVAWIEKKVFGSAVGIQIVPGPGALALVGMGGLLAARRRRA
jgi:hypothetical protein